MRDGGDAYLSDAEHTLTVVYGEMLRQICLDYSCLPDPRTLTLDEIEFFYDGIRGALRRASKKRSGA